MQVKVRLLKWGNSYGLRVKAGDAARLGLHEGDELTIEIPDFSRPRDLRGLPRWNLGGLSTDHDIGWPEEL